jgi:hypothetical protein
VLYLAVLTPSLPALRPGGEWWVAPLAATAWMLLALFWAVRIAGAALPASSRAVVIGVRGLLAAALLCVLAFAAKDAGLLFRSMDASGAVMVILRVFPLYLIPVLLLGDHLRRALDVERIAAHGWNALFLLPGRAARAAAVAAALAAIGTAVLAAQHSSDEAVRQLVRDHRDDILAAAARHDVDPRLVGAIVYVTHRDQLSPFRHALERLVMSAWTRGHWQELGANETMLNRPLDISVGLAQIKPRTAQTASLLALGRAPGDLPQPLASLYFDAEPAGRAWTTPLPPGAAPAPFPVPAPRAHVARALLDARANLETCALILALYQRQWEAANPAWSLRDRPDIVATLYQIGFARSVPHASPRSNAFGRRVREIGEQPWLNELLGVSGGRSATAIRL